MIYIAGAGSFGREVEGWIAGEILIPFIHFIDDIKPGCVKIDEYTPKEEDDVYMAISDPEGRERVVERLNKRGAVFHGLHLCQRPASVSLGYYGIWCPYSLVSIGARIGDFVIVNTFSSVGHDVELGDFCTLSSHVDLCGNVKVGRGVFFGSGARVLPGVKIGDYAKIGAGAVVVKDVPAGRTVLGPVGRFV